MRKLLFLTLMVFTCVISTLQVFAAPAVNFSVKAEIPDNQVDRSKTYFDLRLKPEEKQTIRVQILNSGQEPIIATVTLNPATTGENGIILYNLPASQSLEKYVSVMDLARVDTPQLRVEAGSFATAEITIEMPNEAIEGTILGGLLFTAKEENPEESQNSGTGISFQNEIDYIIALKITEKDIEVSPDFTFAGVEAGQNNHRTAVLVTLENIRPAIVKGMNVQGEIYQKNSDTALRELTLTDVEAAPNSSFPIVFDWQNSRIEAGDYLLKLRVEHEGQEWSFNEEFTINSRQAENSNQNAVNIAPSNNRSWMFVVIAILVVVLSYFVWDKFRRSKKTEE